VIADNGHHQLVCSLKYGWEWLIDAMMVIKKIAKALEKQASMLLYIYQWECQVEFQ
jgi:hypothetical protein